MLTVQAAGEVYEVEVKYQIDELGKLEAALSDAGAQFGEPTSQDDQAYAPAAWSYGLPKTGVPFARLRTQDGSHLFTVKVPRANELSCRESETVVGDRQQMHEALLLLGWVPTVRIVKTRRSALWGTVKVCLDEVQGLGAFMELEQMVHSADAQAGVQEALDAMVHRLGVAVCRTTDTYDSLLQAVGSQI